VHVLEVGEKLAFEPTVRQPFIDLQRHHRPSAPSSSVRKEMPQLRFDAEPAKDQGFREPESPRPSRPVDSRHMKTAKAIGSVANPAATACEPGLATACFRVAGS
jgi:hypothetical protein